MSQPIRSSNILDLTDAQALFELAIEPEELQGPEGLKLINDIKSRAFEAEYTHLYYRDAFRPGIVWLSVLGHPEELPLRGRLDFCHRVAERIFPGFLASIEAVEEDEIMAQIPPLTTSVNGLELATALEYIVFIYPEMVRAWAALIFAYSEIMGLHEGAQRVKNECALSCTNASVVLHLLSDELSAEV